MISFTFPSQSQTRMCLTWQGAGKKLAPLLHGTACNIYLDPLSVRIQESVHESQLNGILRLQKGLWQSVGVVSVTLKTNDFSRMPQL